LIEIFSPHLFHVVMALRGNYRYDMLLTKRNWPMALRVGLA